MSRHAHRVGVEREPSSSRHISTRARYQHTQAMTRPATGMDRPVISDRPRIAAGYPGNQPIVPHR